MASNLQTTDPWRGLTYCMGSGVCLCIDGGGVVKHSLNVKKSRHTLKWIGDHCSWFRTVCLPHGIVSVEVMRLAAGRRDTKVPCKGLK